MAYMLSDYFIGAARRTPGYRIGLLSHKLSNPNVWWCSRCLTTWDFVAGHCTTYRQGRAVFPLCEKCWHELTIEERLPHYRELWEYWDRHGWAEGENWEDMQRAVLEGK